MRLGTPYLLDTTVLIDVGRGREPATTWFGDAVRRPIQTCVSAVTVAEFLAGVRPDQRRDWEYFIDGLTHLEVTKEIAIRAGILRYDLAREGRTMQIADALIAATAVVHGAALVTANSKEFGVPGVETIRLVR